jgi:dTDP-4-amino-4,6-dideoxygalactose transaminase
VDCGIHYPTPIHKIAPFRGSRTVPEGAPVASRLANEILSLPMHPELNREQLERVAHEAHTFVGQCAVA